jgi:hypothetical protein
VDFHFNITCVKSFFCASLVLKHVGVFIIAYEYIYLVHDLVEVMMHGMNNVKISIRRVSFFLIKNFATLMVPCVAEHKIVDHFLQFSSPHRVL